MQSAQLFLFVFLPAVALGMSLPYVDLWCTGVLSFIIGLIPASAFSAILVFAQELIPGKIGLCASLPLLGMIAAFLPNIERRALPPTSPQPRAA